MNGCLVTGSAGALLLLLLGVAVPLAGGTDFNGMPRVLGTALAIVVWLLGVLTAARTRSWVWCAVMLALGPIPLVLYGTIVSDDFTYPEQWDAFARQPWYLIALIVSPLPLLIYGSSRLRERS